MGLYVIKSGMESYSDEELLLRAQEGDSTSFDLLIEKHTRTLYQAIRHLTSDRGEAENIVQEAWLRAWKALDRCKIEQPFFPWFAKIGLNVARDAWRKKRPLDFADLGFLSENIADQDLSIEDQLEKDQALELLMQGVNALREEYRLVISLRYEARLSYQEVAEVMDLPVNTVRTYLHRAKAFLRKWMEVEDVGLAG
ncbi:MAG: hypothetical protein A2Z14_19210 [Chloroflexi bacterium RBG_16_48_8]|nr:MAG: hypothetical protein A2Z14_19210 [Chloroflexi bacterium RBG_16_48_8]